MINIGLVDDHEIFRKSLKSYLELTDKFHIITDSENGLEFLNEIEFNKVAPELLLTDYKMPVMNGLELTKKVKSKFPSIKVIALTAFVHHEVVSKMLESGADGVINKSTSLSTLTNVISLIINDKRIVADENGIIFDITKSEDHFKNIYLSEKQLAFLRLCASSELTYKVIADKMGISPKTADRYREELFKKLNVSSRTGLVIYALQTGIVELFKIA